MASSRKPGPAEPRGQVRDFLSSRLSPGARLCLGYSGGLDSSVLLHVLAGLRRELDFRLAAIHVQHGLSVHADDWAVHCRDACARLGVPLTVSRVRVRNDGRGIEAAARLARYRVFAEQPADFIVLAHQRDDQAETLLFRLLRGAGVHGLAGMAGEGVAADRRTRLLRPLLAIPRDALQVYADEHGLAWVRDESNEETALARNWLRHRVLPLLAERYPACGRVLARTAALMSESDEILGDMARLDAAGAVAGGSLNLVALRRLSPARGRNLLRHWLHDRLGEFPSQARLEEMWRLLLGSGADRHPEWVGAGWVLRRHHDHAVLEPRSGDIPAGAWLWRGETELPLGEHGRLCFTPAEGLGLARSSLPEEGGLVTWRAGGERLRPDCRRPRRPLKDLLREGGVPPDMRARLPLLRIGDRLAWVAGMGVDCDFQAAPGEPGWLIEWRPPGSGGR